jgi:hypothetical protein
LQWFARVAAAFTKPSDILSRAAPPASGFAAESRAESVAAGAGADVTAPEIAAAKSAATSAATADAKIDQDGRAGAVVPGPPDQQEIQRRRELVRALFNDFWSGRDDKPAAFADRLDQAEDYLNERLSASGELWQLNDKTRKALSLPARSNSRNGGSGAAAR